MTLTRRAFARCISAGLIVAMAGFCIATSQTPESAPGVGSRMVGSSTLRITNALLEQRTPDPNLFDLGDAMYNAQITRFLTGAGGVRPYRFAEVNNSLVGQLAFGSSLELTVSGGLIGSVINIANPGAPMVFRATLTDSAGSTLISALGDFQLRMFPQSANMFQFAVDRVNNGLVGQHYVSKLEVLGGSGTVNFSVIAGSLVVNGQPKSTEAGLESIGLSLAHDGTITGRPLQAGNVVFTARATDSANRRATSRAPLGGQTYVPTPDQIISMTIEDNPITATDFTATKVSVKGRVGQFGKDSLTFTGYLNMSGVKTDSLFASEFMFMLGGAIYRGRLNHTGTVVNYIGESLVLNDKSVLTATVNPQTGKVSGRVKKGTFAALLDAQDATRFVNRGTKRYAMAIGVFDSVIASDALAFQTRKVGEKFQADYNAGRIGQQLGGSFQMINVKGTDKRTIVGTIGTTWLAKFLIAPRWGIDTNPGLDALTGISVRIGTRFQTVLSSQMLQTTSKGDTKLTKTKVNYLGVTKLQISQRKGTGSLTTTPIERIYTGLPTASDVTTSATNNFSLGLDFLRRTGNTSFTGEIGKRIWAGNAFSKKFHGWVDATSER